MKKWLSGTLFCSSDIKYMKVGLCMCSLLFQFEREMLSLLKRFISRFVTHSCLLTVCTCWPISSIRQLDYVCIQWVSDIHALCWQLTSTHADKCNFHFYRSTKDSILIKVSTGSVNVVTFNFSNFTHPNHIRILWRNSRLDYCDFHLHSGFEFQFAR